jgi:hypothetical protein
MRQGVIVIGKTSVGMKRKALGYEYSFHLDKMNIKFKNILGTRIGLSF